MSNQCRILLFSVLILCCADLQDNLVQAKRLEHATAAKDKTEMGNHFEGDIMLKAGEKPYGHRKKRELIAANAEFTHIWCNRTVYYTFERILGENYRSIFQAAIDEWAAQTCIEFVLKTEQEHDNYIIFQKSDELGCSSYVGMKGGPQPIFMNDYCLSKGHAIHSIGHAIGLWNEHSRPDRDQYIEVLYNNIIPTEQNNFGILSPEKFKLVPDVGYDIESIMHYGPYAFSDDSNGPAKRTIRLRSKAPLDYKNCSNLLQLGQRDKLSYLDKLRANKLYSCLAHVTALEAVGRTCITQETTSIPTTTLPTKAMPSPLTTRSTIPTPTPPIRLASGSTITLKMENDHPYDEGLICNPVCKNTRCWTLKSFNSCYSIAYRFQIVSIANPDAKKIRSGAIVALRSKNSPEYWLDCSNSLRGCMITNCTLPTSSANASFVTTCDKHFFEIHGVGRRKGRLLNSNHSILLKHEFDDSYLICNTNSGCTLSDKEKASFKFKIIDE